MIFFEIWSENSNDEIFMILSKKIKGCLFLFSLKGLLLKI